MAKKITTLVLKVHPEAEDVALRTLMYKRAKEEILTWFWTAKSGTYIVQCPAQSVRDMHCSAWAIV